jgi:short-subunit dehydrogenase
MTTKSALISASSHGLGKEIASVFAENSYDIILHGRNQLKLKQAKRDLESLGANVFQVIGDVRDPSVIEELYQTSINKDISVLVNNVGIPCAGLPIGNLKDSYIRENIQTNLLSVLNLTTKLFPYLAEKKSGTIITLNSMVGLEPKRHRTIHTASKCGLRGFFNSLRIEAEENGIRIINIYPTQIKTTPDKTYGWEPREVAELIYTAHSNPLFPDEIALDGREKKYRPHVEHTSWIQKRF